MRSLSLFVLLLVCASVHGSDFDKLFDCQIQNCHSSVSADALLSGLATNGVVKLMDLAKGSGVLRDTYVLGDKVKLERSFNLPLVNRLDLSLALDEVAGLSNLELTTEEDSTTLQTSSTLLSLNMAPGVTFGEGELQITGKFGISAMGQQFSGRVAIPLKNLGGGVGMSVNLAATEQGGILTMLHLKSISIRPLGIGHIKMELELNGSELFPGMTDMMNGLIAQVIDWISGQTGELEVELIKTLEKLIVDFGGPLSRDLSPRMAELAFWAADDWVVKQGLDGQSGGRRLLEAAMADRRRRVRM